MRLFKRKQTHKWVVPNQDFLDGGVRYLKGKRYRFNSELADYFERNGWLEGSVAAPPPVADLDIDNGKIGHEGGF